MRHQYQFDSDNDRNRRIDREARKAAMILVGFVIAIPIILFLMGYIAMCGSENGW